MTALLFAFMPVSPSDEPYRVWPVAFFGGVFLVFVMVTRYSSADITLVVEDANVRLLARGRTRKSVEWTEVAKLQFGGPRRAGRPGPYETTLYMVLYGRGGDVRLRLNNGFYRVDHAAFKGAIGRARQIAQARGIPVEEKPI